ncbi:MAG: HD domain-containing protein [Sedimentisphaerales bacterium]|nr:HD domain-containing protein [Sedimentisphaerales bacterium]
MPNTSVRELNHSHRRELERLGEGITQLGVNLAVLDAHDQIVLLLNAGSFESDTQQLIDAAQQTRAETGAPSLQSGTVPVWQFADDHVLLAAELKSPCTGSGGGHRMGVAIIDLGDSSGPLAANTSYFGEMLELLARDFQATVRTDEQMEVVGTELAQVYEELVLLHKLSTNMRVTESDTNFLQLACDSLTELVMVEGIAILLERVVDGDRRFAVAAGSGLIDLDERMTALLHSRLTEEMQRGQEALLDSDVDAPFRFIWPDSVRNIIAVPLCNKDQALGKSGVSIMGFMVAINRLDKPDFDSTDIKLFASVAGGCAVFIENGRLFNELKELFVGSLKALTNSIDAKDQYTRGHSERVAIISRWIAERLAEREPIDDEQIHRIYLTGLLHDVGKIGIDESVLRKNGKLTREERECIQRHPAIGAGILRGIKQMRDIVPGVLCHHERMDGKGYPDGLVGDEIPLTGRIIGLADSFDAMTSKRVYRDAMSVEDALEEIRRGLGSQFDERIGRIFLASDIYHLWDLIQGGGPSVYGVGQAPDYGTAAIGTLLR